MCVGGGAGLFATNISDLSPSRWVEEWEWEETSLNPEQPFGIDAPLPGKYTPHITWACQGVQMGTESKPPPPPSCKHAAAVTYSTLLTGACVDA